MHTMAVYVSRIGAKLIFLDTLLVCKKLWISFGGVLSDKFAENSMFLGLFNTLKE